MEILKKEKRYISERKRMLKEVLCLTLEKEKLEKKIFKLKKEMNAWDRVLLQWKDD